MDAKVGESTAGEYQFSRTQLISLAFFTIAIITLVAVRSDLTESNFVYGLSYLSVAMFCFFIGSYLFIFQHKGNRIPYIGETLEFVGIVALGIGFFYIVIEIVPDSISLEILYLLFLSALVAVASYEVYINYRFFHPRLNG